MSNLADFGIRAGGATPAVSESFETMYGESAGGVLSGAAKESFDAVRITLKRERPIFQMRKHHLGYLDIILNHLPFRETRFGIKNLIKIGDDNFFSIDIQFDFLPRDFSRRRGSPGP